MSTVVNAEQTAERPPTTIFFFDMLKRSVLEYFTLFGNIIVLYMERCIEEVQRRKKGKAVAGFTDVYSTDVPWTNMHSSSTPRRMLLSSLAFGKH